MANAKERKWEKPKVEDITDKIVLRPYIRIT